MIRNPIFAYRNITVFFQESERSGLWEVPMRALPQSETENLVQENQHKEASLNEAKKSFEISRNLVIEKTQEVESIEASRVESLLQWKGFFSGKPEGERREMAKKIVEAYIAKYALRQDELRKSLEQNNAEMDVANRLTQGQIEEKLALIDAHDFQMFSRSETKKLRANEHAEKYSLLLPENERSPENIEKIRAFFLGNSYNYREIRDRIKKENPDIDDAALRKAVKAEIEQIFFDYCQKNDLHISELSLSDETIATEEGVMIQWANVFATLEQKAQAEVVMNAKKDEYIKEYQSYESSTDRETQDWRTIDTPASIETLPVGSSMTFVVNEEQSHTLYNAYREPDGQYTLTFGNIVLKDLPKKEVDVIVNLNSIPVIEKIFSLQSGLYKTLLREYKFLCTLGGADPLENPPIGFTEFIYRRLSEAYDRTNPVENEQFLIGSNLAHLPYKERWRYIADTLRTSEGAKSTMIERLEKQQILVNGRINLSKFPV